ncbi:arf-GAP domain and FG repeat-containing protein 1-like isoform X2 [Melanotaenia boesemani]|uniref:arf-GAP domain and FG repeat-containing protein 1-like isoform X2 n=1 Tax=Melanotaenia boesemani TaxID=1250792 RepID=UPI001C0596D0|nr:arf-GAP domain and FG repeat-containing protein 1-like isoform X2 [Melanotaenia boesemani]XP_041848748.1 arf-GAP domain and FG repeat-containing protein 1-like isoform X2 [Melanotaenia boesemani]
MAASAKRKQEETHLKMLREMTSLPANRKCFDCDQRGPTYVNMTVGSFVCTTCSGILRGLNPPHRVKSISMTTFTQQEIEFLQKHSNEVCKHIWLGLYDDRTLVVPDFREPQKVKEFLQEKYEKKRWYVPPDQARVVASVQASVSGSSASSTGSTPEVQPLKTLQLNKTPLRQSPGLARAQAHSVAQEKKFDLLSDLGGDIFAAPSAQTASSTNFANFAHFPSQSAPQVNSNTNFANFEAFGNTSIPSHLSTSPPSKSFSSGGGVPIPSLSSAVAAQSQTGSCREDRYAALAELDNELSSVSTGSNVQGNIFGPVLGSSPAQNPPVLPSMQPGYGVPSTNPFVAAAIAPDMATNPFQTNGRGPAAASFGTGSMSMPAGFGNASSYCLPTSFSGNFQQQFPGQAPIPYTQPGAYHPQSNGPAFPVYGPNKPSITPFGQPMAVPGMSNNPFMAGAPAGTFPSGGSTNPFL